MIKFLSSPWLTVMLLITGMYLIFCPTKAHGSSVSSLKESSVQTVPLVTKNPMRGKKIPSVKGLVYHPMNTCNIQKEGKVCKKTKTGAVP